MKRTTNQRVDAILTADWHLREDTPVCRTDDFPAAQWDMVRQVSALQQKYSCPVLHAGDLFHHWKPSPALLSKCIDHLPHLFYTVYGNHDLPQHSMDLKWKSGVHTLEVAEALYILPSGHWNDEPKEPNFHVGDRRIYVWHIYTYTGKPPFPGAEENETGNVLLNKYTEFDLILTGDNHQSFVCKSADGRLLVNPGSLTRQTADQFFHEPCVWLYNSDTNTVRAHYLKINKKAVSRVHLEKQKERDERIAAFVERLGQDWEGGLDFHANLKRFAQENKIPEPVMEIAYKTLDET